MRLTLLFILLFSVLSGSGASAAHTAFGKQVFHHSAKQQFASRDITRILSLAGPGDFDTITSFFTVDDDIEDDEDKGNLSFRKCKMPVNSALASAHIITLSRLHGYHLPAALVSSSLSRKYITQRNLRV